MRADTLGMRPHPHRSGAVLTHAVRLAGGVFGALHTDVVGAVPDLSDLRAEDHDPALWDEAKRVWVGRVHTEFRSIQIMNRFLSDVLASGDPLDVYAGCADLVVDEIRHVALARAVCERLGAPATFPEPVMLRLSDKFEAAPPPQRALTTAIGMLTISETISVGLIADLHARCTYRPIRAVLDATLEDESAHESFGWEYVRSSLKRFPVTTHAVWRDVANEALEPHRRLVESELAALDPAQRTLEAFADEARVRLGLFSRQRQALVVDRVIRETLTPKLAALDLV